MQCATHPNVETNLQCGKCGQPICPKCMVQTPVGARCRDCARLYRLPTYTVSAKYYLKAIGTALASAIVCGVAWWVIGTFLPYYFGLLLAAATGYAIGELVSISVNHKRGIWLATIAGIAVILGYLVNILSPGGLPSGPLQITLDLIGVALGITIAVNRLR